MAKNGPIGSRAVEQRVWAIPVLRQLGLSLDEQMQGFFDITTAILPLKEAGDEAIAKVWDCADRKNVRSDIEEMRNLSNSIPESDKPPYLARYGNSTGLWQLQVDLCNRMSAARRTMRNFPKVSQKSGKIPAKCTLMGNFEQLGPADRAQANEFWAHARTRSYDGHALESESDSGRCRW